MNNNTNQTCSGHSQDTLLRTTNTIHPESRCPVPALVLEVCSVVVCVRLYVQLFLCVRVCLILFADPVHALLSAIALAGQLHALTLGPLRFPRFGFFVALLDLLQLIANLRAKTTTTTTLILDIGQQNHKHPDRNPATTQEQKRTHEFQR